MYTIEVDDMGGFGSYSATVIEFPKLKVHADSLYQLFLFLNESIEKATGEKGPFSFKVSIAENWFVDDNEPVMILHAGLYGDIIKLFDASLCSYARRSGTGSYLNIYLEINNSN